MNRSTIYCKVFTEILTQNTVEIFNDIELHINSIQAQKSLKYVIENLPLCLLANHYELKIDQVNSSYIIEYSVYLKNAINTSKLERFLHRLMSKKQESIKLFLKGLADRNQQLLSQKTPYSVYLVWAILLLKRKFKCHWDITEIKNESFKILSLNVQV